MLKSRVGQAVSHRLQPTQSSVRGEAICWAAAVPNHFQNVSGASPDALGAADAGVVDFDAMRH